MGILLSERGVWAESGKGVVGACGSRLCLAWLGMAGLHVAWPVWPWGLILDTHIQAGTKGGWSWPLEQSRSLLLLHRGCFLRAPSGIPSSPPGASGGPAGWPPVPTRLPGKQRPVSAGVSLGKKSLELTLAWPGQLVIRLPALSFASVWGGCSFLLFKWLETASKSDALADGVVLLNSSCSGPVA